MNPKHSIDYCPICGGGLCGIRICGLSSDSSVSDSPVLGRRGDNIHGLIVCDECEAIWLDPNVSTDHLYPDPVHALCPVCRDPLWGDNSRWASHADIEALGWSDQVNHDLDIRSDEGIA